MPSATTDPSLRRAPQLTLPPPPPDQPQPPLPCPRCDSKNTKFCYYNNYNLAQPRHFCKSCRRYWTQGGTLRDVPVGGGTRKKTKRTRTTSPTTTAVTAATTIPTSYNPLSAHPISSLPISMMGVGVGGGGGGGVGVGGFTSLLNTHGNGFLALNGFGSGYDDMGGYDIGKGAWPLCLPDIGEGTDSSSGAGGGGITWQLGIGGDGGFGDSECLAWPELAMSTPRKGVK